MLLWLQRLGITGVQPRAAGVWLQDDRAVRFLLHVDDDGPARGSAASVLRPVQALAGYRPAGAGVPASCLLVLCPSAGRERLLHADPAAEPVPLPVAATTPERLADPGDPSGPVWSVTVRPAGAIRLIRPIDITTS